SSSVTGLSTQLPLSDKETVCFGETSRVDTQKTCEILQNCVPPLHETSIAVSQEECSINNFESNTVKERLSLLKGQSSAAAVFDSSKQVVAQRPKQTLRSSPLQNITNSILSNVNHNNPTTRGMESQLLEDCGINEQIRRLVLCILPSLEESLLNTLIHTLVDVNGVESLEDLKLVEIDWLTKAGLKPIQAKKVLLSFSKQQGGQEKNCEGVKQSGKKNKKAPKDKNVLLRIEQGDENEVIASRPALCNLQLQVGKMNLVIDFGKFKDTLLRALENKEIPSASDRQHMVRVISCDIMSKYEELKQFSRVTQKTPGKEIYKSVVDIIFKNDITQETLAYAFEDKLNGVLVKDGKYSLTHQIEVCCENKARAIRRNVQPESAVARKGSRRASCILPDKYCPPLSKAQKQEANEIRLDLLTIFKGPQISWDWMKIKALLSKYSSMAAQRLMITSKKRDISLIIEHWPFLTEISGLLCHLDYITGSSLSENVEKFVECDLDLLIKYLTLMSPKRVQLLKTKEAIMFGNGSEIHRKLLGALIMLAIHWGEDQSSILLCVEEDTMPHEVSDMLPDNAPSTPLIVALGSTPYLASDFYLMMDGVCICSNLKNGLEAVMALCASYFVFGVLYPPNASTTLIYLERVVANLYDSNGLTKAQTSTGAVTHTSHSKCQLLQQDIKKFEKELGDTLF
ncbi:Ceroid-lipofuscinosis neuronal protein 6-like protein, partial [Frankliniella fusca]